MVSFLPIDFPLDNVGVLSDHLQTVLHRIQINTTDKSTIKKYIVLDDRAKGDLRYQQIQSLHLNDPK